MNIGNFTFQEQGNGKVFIQIEGEGGDFNWSNVPSIVKAVLRCKDRGVPYPADKDKQALEAMHTFWKKHF